MLFKLKTDRALKGLVVPKGVLMSFANSESGSYDLEAFLAYLRRWLPEMDEERTAEADYRILVLDAYSVHHCQEVKDLAAERGYVIAYHRGGVTPIMQWNDTDAHKPFEVEYLQLENIDFLHQLEDSLSALISYYKRMVFKKLS